MRFLLDASFNAPLLPHRHLTTQYDFTKQSPIPPFTNTNNRHLQFSRNVRATQKPMKDLPNTTRPSPQPESHSDFNRCCLLERLRGIFSSRFLRTVTVTAENAFWAKQFRYETPVAGMSLHFFCHHAQPIKTHQAAKRPNPSGLSICTICNPAL